MRMSLPEGNPTENPEPLNEATEAKRIRALRLRSHFHDAEVRANRALRSMPKSALLHLERGMLRFDWSRHHEAIVDLEKACEIAPDYEDAQIWLHVARSDELRLQGDFAGAERLVRAAVRCWPHVHLWNQLGLVHYHAKEFDKAVDAFDHSLCLDGKDRFAQGWRFVARGAELRMAPEFPRDEARKLLASTAHLDRNPDVFCERGWLDLSLGNDQGALSAFRSAISLRPWSAVAHTGLGAVLANRQADLAEAEMAFRTAIDLARRLSKQRYAEAHAGLGVVFAMQERLAEAEAELRTAVDAGDRAWQTANNLAKVLIQRGNPEDAERYLRSWVRKDIWQISGTLAGVHMELADKYHDDEHYRDAIEDINHSVRHAPAAPTADTDKDNLAFLYLQRGIAYGNLQQYGPARRDLRRCVHICHAAGGDLAPSALTARRNLRRINDRIGRPLETPRWVMRLVAALAVAGVGYGCWLVQRGILKGSDFTPLLLGGLFFVVLSAVLPTISRLKVAGAELEKVVGTPTALHLEHQLTQVCLGRPFQPFTWYMDTWRNQRLGEERSLDLLGRVKPPSGAAPSTAARSEPTLASQ